ncbi:hypothetical protein D3C72_950120 [compost metagenome]
MGGVVHGVGVGDKIINRHLRNRSVDQADSIGAGAVSGHVADARVDRHVAVGEGTHIGGRNAQLPAAVILHNRLIGFAVQGEGHGLARLRAGAAA